MIETPPTPLVDMIETPPTTEIGRCTSPKIHEYGRMDWESAGCHLRRDGKVLLSGPAESLFRAWKTHLRRTLLPHYGVAMETPTFIDRATLDATQYAEHFPQHLLHGRARGGEMDLCLTPAACFHVYPILERRMIGAEGFSALVTGPCARYESGTWDPPYRLASFNMTELVVAGSPDLVAAKRRAVLACLEHLFDDLGLPGSFATAVDAFYLDAARGAQLLQQLKELKKEFQTPYGPSAVALASVNDHEDYFGRCFGLQNPDGTAAHSFCAAFGLERLTAVGLMTWGPSPENWPEALRS